MKNFILFLLLAPSLYSQAFTYVGLGYGYYNENYTNIDAKSSNNLASLKIGYGDRKAYAVELSLENLKNSAKIFSKKDSNKNSMDINLIKAFDFKLLPIPFLKAGIGAGVFNIDGQFQKRLHYGSFNLGLGLFIPINEYFEFELSFTQKFISYEGIDTIVEDVSYESTMSVSNFGFNVRF